MPVISLGRGAGVGAALAVALLPASAHAQESVASPWIWASPSLFGLESTVCEPHAEIEQTATIAPAFCTALALPFRQQLGQAFAAAMKRSFPRVEDHFAEHVASGVGQTQRLKGSLAASLRLSRATLAVVRKPVGVEVFVPITLTLDITDMSNGEVVFTRTRTDIASGTRDAAEVEQTLAREVPGLVTRAMQNLVETAAPAFVPSAQRATVIGAVTVAGEGKAWVIDKGRNIGLRKNDAIGDDGQIIAVGPDHAIVRPALEAYRTGQVLTRLRLAPAETLARPSLLAVVDLTPADFSPSFVRQTFEDAVGASGAFAPVPVNPAYGHLRRAVLSDATSSVEDVARPMPDYIALLRVAVLDPATYPSNLPGVEIDHFEAFVSAIVVDRTGRVVGSWQGQNALDDRVNAGVHFPADKRREAVLRNALVDLSTKLATFQPQPLALPVLRKDGALYAADPTGAIPMQTTFEVMRPAGRFPGIAGEVLVPVGQATARTEAEGGVILSDDGISPLVLRGKETLTLENTGQPSGSRRAIAQCLDDLGKPAFDSRGAFWLPTWPAIAEAAFARNVSGAIFVNSLPGRLKVYSASFNAWENFPAARTRASDLCFIPQIMVEPAAGSWNIAVGYGLRQQGAKVGAAALRQTLRPTAIPETASPQSRRAMAEADLTRAVSALAQQVAAQVKPSL